MPIRTKSVPGRGGTGDAVFAGAVRIAGVVVLVLMGAIIVTLAVGGWPAFRTFGAGFVVDDNWDPVAGIFGGLVPIYGTLVTAAMALVMAVPLAFGIAFFLTELAPAWARRPVGTAVELLAAVPSIIYGMWGFFVIVPVMAQTIQPPIIDTLGDLPFIGTLFSGAPFGTGLFTAALVLAIMIIPFIAATMRDVFLTVPAVYKESAYGLGATRWEVMRVIVLPYTRASVVGGIMLGLGRALGETMAVTFVIGNANRIATSIFGSGNTIASLVALEFPESPAGSLKLSALLALGFILFVISFVVLALSRLLLRRQGAAARPVRAAQPGAGAVVAARAAVEREAGQDAGRGMVGGQRVVDAGLRGRRRLSDRVVTGLCLLATCAGLLFLASILATLLWRGLPGLDLHALTDVTRAPGSNGGLLNAIVGSLILTGLGTLLGTPVGLMVGTYLSEYGAGSRLATAVRFVSDVLLSAPSILIGLFVYQVLVAPFGGFSGWAGAVALAVIVVPIVVRTTEDMLRLIPVAMREAAVALGAPKWKAIVLICYRAALDGILTGVLLAVARVAGETAPLLFTSLGNLNWSVRLDSPMASLPITIYQYAGSAYADWVQLAWTGALLVTTGVLTINIAARLAVRRRA